MKLINAKEINKIFEDNDDPGEFFNFDEEEKREPCWQATVDRERGLLLFLVDNKELLSCSLDGLDPAEFKTAMFLSACIRTLREQGPEALIKELNEKGIKVI